MSTIRWSSDYHTILFAGFEKILHALKKKELTDIELKNIEEIIGLPDGKERDICNN